MKQFTIAIMTSHCKQAMIPMGSGFCMLLEVLLLYPLTMKTILSVRCYEQQVTFVYMILFSVKMTGGVKRNASKYCRDEQTLSLHVTLHLSVTVVYSHMHRSALDLKCALSL